LDFVILRVISWLAFQCFADEIHEIAVNYTKDLRKSIETRPNQLCLKASQI
jgi:hypothetical protein